MRYTVMEQCMCGEGRRLEVATAHIMYWELQVLVESG